MGLLHQPNARLTRGAAAFAQVARCTGRGNIFPTCSAALRAGDDMIKRQIFGRSAILALKAVAQEEIEPCKSGVF